MAAGVIPTTEPEKRGRGRPKGSGSSTTAKKPGKAGDLQQTKDMVKTLLLVSLNVASMRMGEHWKIRPEEAEAIAEPMGNIMDRLNLTEKTGAYGDYIALGAALLMVFGPRIMTTMDHNKRKGGLKIVKQPEQATKPASPGTGGQPNADASQANGNHQPAQQRDPVYRPSDVKQSLAWITG